MLMNLTNIKLYFLYLRNIIMNNFFVKLCSIKYKNQYYPLNNKYINIMLFFCKIIPFILLKKLSSCFKLDLIYKIDNIYYITNINKLTILPILLNLTVNNKNKEINITSIIKYYNSNIPLSFLYQENNLIEYDTINISYLKSGIIIKKQLDYNEYKDKLISDLFI